MFFQLAFSSLEVGGVCFFFGDDYFSWSPIESSNAFGKDKHTTTLRFSLGPENFRLLVQFEAFFRNLPLSR